MFVSLWPHLDLNVSLTCGLCATLGTLFVAVFLHWVYLVFIKYPRSQYPPGPLPLPLVGNMLLIKPHAFHDSLLELAQKHGPVVTYWLTTTPWVLIASPEGMKSVFQDHAQAFDRESKIVRLWHDIAGGLALQRNGKEHKRSRDVVKPAFRASNINNMVGLVVNCTTQLLNNLERHTNSGEPLDMQNELQKLTFDIIGVLCMGFDFKTQTERESPYIKAFNYCMKHLIFRFISPIEYWKFYRTKGVEEYDKQMDFLVRTIKGIIHQRRKTGVKDGESDILGFMLQANQCGEWVDDDEILRQMITFLLAGHDTTANILTWLFFFVSQQPSVKAKLLHEIDTALCDQIPSKTNLNLPYLDKVLNETLRLRPSTPTLGRELTEDVEVTVEGKVWKFSKGTKFSVSPFVLAHLPQSGWKDPDRFDPEREEWKVEDGKKPAPFTFVPFGSGPRACIGEDMARKEIKTVVSMVLQRYELRLVPGHNTEMEMATTLKARYGMKMTVHKRTK